MLKNSLQTYFRNLLSQKVLPRFGAWKQRLLLGVLEDPRDFTLILKDKFGETSNRKFKTINNRRSYDKHEGSDHSYEY